MICIQKVQVSSWKKNTCPTISVIIKVKKSLEHGRKKTNTHRGNTSVAQHSICSTPIFGPTIHSPPTSHGRYVPRVHAEDSGLCGLVFTDDQLVRRCRSFRKNAPWKRRRWDGGDGVGDGCVDGLGWSSFLDFQVFGGIVWSQLRSVKILFLSVDVWSWLAGGEGWGCVDDGAWLGYVFLGVGLSIFWANIGMHRSYVEAYFIDYR
jgi:hypothetical protein